MRAPHPLSLHQADEASLNGAPPPPPFCVALHETGRHCSSLWLCVQARFSATASSMAQAQYGSSSSSTVVAAAELVSSSAAHVTSDGRLFSNGADLRSAQLRSATFRRGSAVGASFRYSDLRGVQPSASPRGKSRGLLKSPPGTPAPTLLHKPLSRRRDFRPHEPLARDLPRSELGASATCAQTRSSVRADAF